MESEVTWNEETQSYSNGMKLGDRIYYLYKPYDYNTNRYSEVHEKRFGTVREPKHLLHEGIWADWDRDGLPSQWNFMPAVSVHKEQVTVDGDDDEDTV